MKSSIAFSVGLAILTVTLTAGIAGAATVCGTWHSAPAPNPSSEVNRFTAVAAVSTSDVWAVGFYDADPDPMIELDQSLIAHWNGSTWSVVPSPNVGPSGTVLTGAVAVASNDVWAVGYSSTYGTPQTLTLHWNGSRWSVIPSPVVQGGSAFEAITAVSSIDIWAVGYRAGGMPDFHTTTGTMVAHWNGSSWTEAPSPNIGDRHNELDAVTAISQNDLWAVGTWRNIGGNYQTLTEHWNGSSWSIVASPNPSIDNQLSAVAGVSGNDVWANGSASDGVTGIPLFFHWTGSAWNQVSSPGGAGGGLITIASDDAWAVAGNIAHWNGTAWSLVPNPTVTGAAWLSLKGVAAVAGCEAWAVGSQGGDILSSSARTLAVQLTAGGGVINQPPVVKVSASPSSGPAPLTVSFSSAGSLDPDGSIVSYLWNFGDSTYPPDQTSPNPVHTYTQTGPLTYHATLSVIDDRGGTASASVQINITTATPTVHVASQSVSRVQLANGRLQANDVVQVVDGNGAPVAGATVSARFNGPTSGSISGITGALGAVTLKSTAAKRATQPWCFTVISISASGSTYLPSANVVTTQCESSSGASLAGASDMRIESRASGARIHFSLGQPAVADVRIFDVAGRQVRALVRRQWLESGAHAIDWDGRSDTGQALPSGIYFARADAAGVRSLGRICIVR
jgi:PKD domain-containing protein